MITQNLKPVMTEKAHQLMTKGVYTFIVGKGVNKNEIKTAVKNLFSVDAISVNIAPLRTKSKRIGKTRKFTAVGGHGKKAIVKLKPGQTIAVLSPKTEAKTKKLQKGSSEKDVQKVKVEGKEGA